MTTHTTHTTDTSLILGHTLQHDASGRGHCWRTISVDSISADRVEELEGEILDGGRETGEIVLGGQHYRWL